MGLGLGIAFCLVTFIVVGFMVFQARFAARRWRQVIAAGDMNALEDLLDQTFEGWRNGRPPRGVAPADWRALHTAALIDATPEHARVSLLVDPDVRVVQGQRVEVGTAQEVARRAAVRMVERLMYEVPYVSFTAVQVDVHTEYRSADGDATNPCLLTTRATREVASWSDWSATDASTLLSQWETREASPGKPIDCEVDALLPSQPATTDEMTGTTRGLDAAERTTGERPS